MTIIAARIEKPTLGPIQECQISGSSDLRPVIFLGYLPPVTTMRHVGSRPEVESRFPAELFYCPQSHLVQLGLIVDPKILFHPDYPYTSGSTRILRENFANLHSEVDALVGLAQGDLVVDIGSNDGTLLSNFLAHGHRVVGIEPTQNGETARARGVQTIISFFNRESVAQVKSQYGSPKVITAANVFAHMNNIHGVVDAIEELLSPDGVFVSESHYLGSLIETLQYDTIYHEHLRYYSVHSIQYLLNAHGFRIFHVSRIPTHGGSIRVYATRSDRYAADETVERILGEEVRAGLTSDAWIHSFRKRIIDSKLALHELLAPIKREGKRIYGIGAPARSTTLISYTGLDDGILDCVLEVAGSRKIGRYVPGTNIPVLDEDKLLEDQPPYALLLSWHIADELCTILRRKGYKGDFIVPLPEPRIVRF